MTVRNHGYDTLDVMVNMTSISFLKKASGRLASVIAYRLQLNVPYVIDALKKLKKVTLFVTCRGIPAFIRLEKSVTLIS